MSYDTWGKRRDVSNWNTPRTGSFGSTAFDRGYAGHEHLDHVGLIYMNGRVYDPELGRFKLAASERYRGNVGSSMHQQPMA